MKLKALLGLIRPFRHFHFLLITFIGALLVGISSVPSLILALLISFFSWTFAVSFNDIYDQTEDLINEIDRPLVSGKLSKKEMSTITLLVAMITFTFGIILSYFTTLWILIITSATIFLGIAYSLPKVRLKKYPFIATGIIGLGTFLVFLVGAFSQTSSLDQNTLTFGMILFILLTLVSLSKDLKDVKGDRKAGIITLPTLFGKVAGARLTALFGVLGYVLSSLIYIEISLLFFAVVASAIHSYLCLYFKKSSYAKLFLNYYAYLLIFILISKS
jgi:4-hydroxybenzoate polyprenyltransferase